MVRRSRTQPTTSAAISLTPSTTSSSTRSKRVPVVAPARGGRPPPHRRAVGHELHRVLQRRGGPVLLVGLAQQLRSAARSKSSSSATSTWITRERALLSWRWCHVCRAAHTPSTTTRVTPPPTTQRWWVDCPAARGLRRAFRRPPSPRGSEPPPPQPASSGLKRAVRGTSATLVAGFPRVAHQLRSGLFAASRTLACGGRHAATPFAARAPLAPPPHART